MLTSANNLLPVARVLKSFGTKGELLIRYAPDLQKGIDKKRPVFIYFDGLPVPFFIDTIQDKGKNQAIVKFESIDTEALATEVSGEFVFIEIPQTGKSSKTGKAAQDELISFEQLIGFYILDKRGNMIGVVKCFYDYPNNPCLGILKSGNQSGETLLPLHEDFILNFDSQKKEIVVELPEGLLDI